MDDVDRCLCVHFRVYTLDENIVLWWFFVSSVISRAFIYFTLLFVHKTVIYRIFYYAQSILFENCEAQEKTNNFLQLNIMVFNVSILILKHSTHKCSAVLFCLHEKCRIKEINFINFIRFFALLAYSIQYFYYYYDYSVVIMCLSGCNFVSSFLSVSLVII